MYSPLLPTAGFLDTRPHHLPDYHVHGRYPSSPLLSPTSPFLGLPFPSSPSFLQQHSPFSFPSLFIPRSPAAGVQPPARVQSPAEVQSTAGVQPTRTSSQMVQSSQELFRPSYSTSPSYSASPFSPSPSFSRQNITN